MKKRERRRKNEREKWKMEWNSFLFLVFFIVTVFSQEKILFSYFLLFIHEQ